MDPEFPKLDMRDIDDTANRSRLVARFNRFNEERVYPYMLKILTAVFSDRIQSAEERIYRRVVGTLNATKLMSEAAVYLRNISVERERLEQVAAETKTLKQGVKDAGTENKAELERAKGELQQELDNARTLIQTLQDESRLMKKLLKIGAAGAAAILTAVIGEAVYLTKFAYENTDGLRRKDAKIEEAVSAVSAGLEKEAAERKRIEKLLCTSEYRRAFDFSAERTEREEGEQAAADEAKRYASALSEALDEKTSKAVISTSASLRNYCAEKTASAETSLLAKIRAQESGTLAQISRLSSDFERAEKQQILEMNALKETSGQELIKLAEQEECLEYLLEEQEKNTASAYESLKEQMERQSGICSAEHSELRRKTESIEKSNGRKRFFGK